ncbi:hypothetical protein [Dactylosporangium matsuzakiense]|uniref:Uncharacterized protein n=1 Tax=Dactylosporangium matsuzakiense TaxID=53360 RepID=A0A9W6KLS0_9ACTN|nr:hypothetical protein [Dactylosporangium matsuzakiense]GLL02480.1 hypothetical protein GCM10017581_042220 [Dactylosporangium matsuzakiense]
MTDEAKKRRGRGKADPGPSADAELGWLAELRNAGSEQSDEFAGDPRTTPSLGGSSSAAPADVLDGVNPRRPVPPQSRGGDPSQHARSRSSRSRPSDEPAAPPARFAPPEAGPNTEAMPTWRPPRDVLREADTQTRPAPPPPPAPPKPPAKPEATEVWRLPRDAARESTSGSRPAAAADPRRESPSGSRPAAPVDPWSESPSGSRPAAARPAENSEPWRGGPAGSRAETGRGGRDTEHHGPPRGRRSAREMAASWEATAAATLGPSGSPALPPGSTPPGPPRSAGSAPQAPSRSAGSAPQGPSRSPGSVAQGPSRPNGPAAPIAPAAAPPPGSARPDTASSRSSTPSGFARADAASPGEPGSSAPSGFGRAAAGPAGGSAAQSGFARADGSPAARSSAPAAPPGAPPPAETPMSRGRRRAREAEQESPTGSRRAAHALPEPRQGDSTPPPSAPTGRPSERPDERPADGGRGGRRHAAEPDTYAAFQAPPQPPQAPGPPPPQAPGQRTPDRGNDPRTGDVRGNDPRTGDLRKGGEPRTGDVRGGEPRTGDLRKGGEPRTGDVRGGEPRTGDVRGGGEPRTGDVRGGGPRHGGPDGRGAGGRGGPGGRRGGPGGPGGAGGASGRQGPFGNGRAPGGQFLGDGPPAKPFVDLARFDPNPVTYRGQATSPVVVDWEGATQVAPFGLLQRAQVKRVRQLRYATIIFLVLAVIGAPVAFFVIRELSRDPVFAELDELNLPEWAARNPTDGAVGSRWCINECRSRQRTWESARGPDETNRAFVGKLRDAGWVEWDIPDCQAEGVDGIETCWQRDEYVLDLWVRAAVCDVKGARPTISPAPPAATGGARTPTGKASAKAPSAAVSQPPAGGDGNGAPTTICPLAVTTIKVFNRISYDPGGGGQPGP